MQAFQFFVFLLFTFLSEKNDCYLFSAVSLWFKSTRDFSIFYFIFFFFNCSVCELGGGVYFFPGLVSFSAFKKTWLFFLF